MAVLSPGPPPGSTPPAEDWAGIRGQRWLADLDRLEAMLAPVGEALLARAAPAPGERVADIGCGGGWTTRRIAAAVAPRGHVTGIDISPDLVAEARRRAAAEGLAGIRFVVADAATLAPPDPPFDRLISRYGVMFFPEPEAGFRSLCRLLRPGGRLDVAVWAEPRDNPWMMEIRNRVAAHVEVPRPEPLAPGPFQLASRAYLETMLPRAGFADPDIFELRHMIAIGGPGASAAEAADFALRALAIAELLDGCGPEARAACRADLEAFYAAIATPEGIRLPAASWLVSARRAD